ncbi:unnamed protein product [Lactuca virosa]|uniref:Leucine-rich repeat-containing N-terminal plant-type domain-containing protein n=1 Tax=Lactuca virosa TaxID=75947 RepID=A0AAU9PSJ2_9ASTR|nr:unnamed protein product [Lactuca virosa]
MHPFVLISFSLLLLLCLETTTSNQLVRDDDVVMIVMNKCLDKERHALLHFKSRLQVPFDTLSTWTAADDECCTWEGVTCNNQTGRVTQLDISRYNIGGEISHSLLNLSYLNYLDLSYNPFNCSIPIFIGFMTELRYLDLSYNSFFGTIPPEFGNLTNLQWLYLGDVGSCRVENIEWLSHLSHLEALVLDGISLAKQNYWTDVIFSLQKLSDLSLRGCELSQVMYPYSSFFNSSTSIHILLLGNNSLNSSMYHWLFPLISNKLRFLDLSSNMLDGIPKYLGNLCSLEYLSFDNNSVVVKFPDFLNNLSGCTSLTLQQLDASGSQFIGSLSDEIHKFSSLTDLDLSKNQLSGTISEKLWELPRLEVLDVSFNSLRGSISENIGKSKLLSIDLSRNSLQGVPSLDHDHISNLSYLENIDLSYCKLGPRFPKWIQTLKNLTYLDISNTKISDTIPVEF